MKPSDELNKRSSSSTFYILWFSYCNAVKVFLQSVCRIKWKQSLLLINTHPILPVIRLEFRNCHPIIYTARTQTIFPFSYYTTKNKTQSVTKASYVLHAKNSTTSSNQCFVWTKWWTNIHTNLPMNLDVTTTKTIYFQSGFCVVFRLEMRFMQNTFCFFVCALYWLDL